jgi:hypothetical protein
LTQRSALPSQAKTNSSRSSAAAEIDSTDEATNDESSATAEETKQLIAELKIKIARDAKEHRGVKRKGAP